MRNLILSALILASAFQTAMGQTDGAWTYTVANNQATITGYTGPGGAVSIPSTVNRISVVQLSSNNNPIFGLSNTSVTSVIIPNSVTSIGGYAFSGCTSLTSITIPSSVTSIGGYAFQGCTGLTSVTIPNSVTSIQGNVFQNCIRLASVTIPNSVTSIGGYAFNGTALTSITIPTSVTWIGDYAFQGCTGLTSVTIPNSVTSIPSNAFYGCTSLTSVTIPNSVTSIGGYAFFGCTSLTSVTIPSSVTSIGGYAFNLCTPQLVSSIISNLASNSASNYTTGQQGVIANPNAHNLYTTSQIQNMAVGDLVLNRQVDGSFVLNYDIEKSEDLQSWTTYAPLSLTLTNLPTNKAFIRIKAKQ